MRLELGLGLGLGLGSGLGLGLGLGAGAWAGARVKSLRFARATEARLGCVILIDHRLRPFQGKFVRWSRKCPL